MREIHNSVSRKFTHKSDLEEVLKYVYELSDYVLKTTGEEI